MSIPSFQVPERAKHVVPKTEKLVTQPIIKNSFGSVRRWASSFMCCRKGNRTFLVSASAEDVLEAQFVPHADTSRSVESRT